MIRNWTEAIGDANPIYESEEAAVAAGDASPGDLAYLTDRVLVAQGEPQVYGTQWGTNAAGEWEPAPPSRMRRTWMRDARPRDSGRSPTTSRS